MFVVPCATHIFLRTPPGLGYLDEKYASIKCPATTPHSPELEVYSSTLLYMEQLTSTEDIFRAPK